MVHSYMPYNPNTQVRIFHKIRMENLSSMRSLRNREKRIDLRVQDPDDSEKIYENFSRGDILHYLDMNGDVLRVYLMDKKSYTTVEEALKTVGYHNVCPFAKNLRQAVKECESYGNYRKFLRENKGSRKTVYIFSFLRFMIYVAGPYTPTSSRPGTLAWKRERLGNIEQARNIGKDILHLGYLPVVPHTLFSEWESIGSFDEEVIIEAEKALVHRCEGFYYIASSKGTDAERKLAGSLGIPVFTSMDCMRKWKPVNEKRAGAQNG